MALQEYHDILTIAPRVYLNERFCANVRVIALLVDKPRQKYIYTYTHTLTLTYRCKFNKNKCALL